MGEFKEPQGVNKSENVSYGQDSDISIKKYEEKVSKLARSYNTFIENLLGNGIILKEDIIEIDAEMEKDLREEPWWGDKKYVQNNINSNLTLSEKQVKMSKKEKSDNASRHYVNKTISHLSGEVRGQNIEIIRDRIGHPFASSVRDEVKFNGTLDGKDLSQEESEEIFYKYSRFQKDRLSKIDALIEKRKDDKNKGKRTQAYKGIKKEFTEAFDKEE